MTTGPIPTPPKFVPTLTEVVQVAAEPEAEADTKLVSAQVPALEPEPEPERIENVVIERQQGYELPTPVLDDEGIDMPPLESSAPSPAHGESTAFSERAEAESVATSQPLPDGYEEYVVHRVMQRVELILESRLRDAITRVIEEQTRSIVPRLREEVEFVVRESVYDAVAQELDGVPR